jgi:3-hydroxybutyryl-CoA dehydratase
MKEILSQEIKIGQTVQTSKQITQTDLILYAAVTGDFNPVHFDPVYSAQTRFKEPIAHGMIAAGLISGLIGMRLPGPGTVYLKQSLDFLVPVKINDVITACVEVIALLERNRVRLKTSCINQEGVIVLKGEALVIAPNRALVTEANQSYDENPENH